MALAITLTPGYAFTTDGTDKVTYAKLNQLGSPVISLSGSVGSSQIEDGAVISSKIADDAVVSDKIKDGSIGLSKLLTADQGTILHRNATGWELLPPGTTGQVLTTYGTEEDAAWGTVPTVETVNPSQIVAGSANTHLVTNGSGDVAWEAENSIGATCVVWEEQANGAYGHAGAVLTANTDTTRFLTDISDPSGIASLDTSTHEVTLQAGTYLVDAKVPGRDTEHTTAWLCNAGTSAVLINGSPNYSDTSSSNHDFCFVHGIIVLTAETAVQLKMRASQGGGNRFGQPAGSIGGSSQPEIYTTMAITRIA